MINSDIFVTIRLSRFCFVLNKHVNIHKAFSRLRADASLSTVEPDGKTETITAPSALAQEALIRKVYSKARLDPAKTRFFEAHGTGTLTGDPLEISAISSVFSSYRSANDPLYIGSVKTNISYTKTSSSLASIIRTTLAIEKGQIPPSGTFKQANPTLKLDERFIKVPKAL
ncbi:hypothetical protein D6C89_07602 [Aureobasidium pullulans]|nr:hypothetical protein D6C89_07602 [Aureobasidium pullulans]